MGLRRSLGILGLSVALVSLFLLPRVVWAEEPLSISMSSSRDTCTVGTHTEIAWTVNGGTAPYVLSINGSAIDAGVSTVKVLCRLGEELNAPTHINAFDRMTIPASVADASDRSAKASVSLQLIQPLAPPVRAFAGVWQSWDDYREARLYAGVDSQMSLGFKPRSDPLALFVTRWRHVGSGHWNYLAEEEPDSGNYYSRTLDTVPVGTEYEVQLAQIRSAIEVETPEALRWTRILTAISAGPPNDVTVQTSSDSAIVTWHSNRRDTLWVLRLVKSSDASKSLQSHLYVPLSGQHNHSFEFANLLPDTSYSLSLFQGNATLLPEVTFDFRTEPERFDASRAFPRPRITSVSSTPDGSGLVVEWDAPAIKSGRSFSVYAHEFATPVDWRSVQEVSAEMRSATITPVRPDTLYRVVVSNRDVHQTRDEVLVRTPPKLVLHGVNQSLGPPAAAVDWNTSNEYFNKLNIFVVDWVPDHGHRFGQVQWQTLGRTMNTFGHGQVPIQVSQPGYYRFRTRLRVGDRWTRWSHWRDAFTTPSPPRLYGTGISERKDYLLVHWLPPKHSLTPVDGYRVYVRRNEGLEQIFDVGLQTQLRVPYEGVQTDFDVQVSALNDRFGEGRRSAPVVYRAGNAPLLHAEMLRCDPHAGLPGAVRWQIERGAAPYRVWLEGESPQQTWDRSGETIVSCDTPIGDEPPRGKEVTLMVEDANGRRSDATVTVRPIQVLEEQKDRTVSIAPVNVFSVTATEAYLGWPCYAWSVYGWEQYPSATFQLRWRTEKSHAWRYRPIETGPLGPKLGFVCRWTWNDLSPGTRYEFQLAHEPNPASPTSSDLLDWTPVESFTTLTEPRNVSIQRNGDDVAVTWSAQEDAWLYLVVLKGDQSSWWRLYRPSGEPTERTSFDGIDSDSTLAVEITSPPEFHRQPLIAPGFERFIPPH